MFSDTLFVFLTVCILLDFSHGQRSKKFFRQDYTYIEEVKSFYKIHMTPQTWFDAKRECAQEGASLYYPRDEDEQNAVTSFRKNTQPNIHWVFIGMSDLLTEGYFETIDGKSVSEVYNNWESEEPNDANRKEDCVQQNLEGRMNDRECSDKERFICKKSLLSLKWNYRCNMPILDYTLNIDTGKCYKLHRTSLKWSEAYAVCRSEQTHLATVNNSSEADYLEKLVESASQQRIGGYHQLNRGIYHLGFLYSFKEGWRTVSGSPLAVDDDAWWDNHQPIVDEHEQCGSMFYNGRLNSINCDTKSFFICEHEVDNSTLSDENF